MQSVANKVALKRDPGTTTVADKLVDLTELQMQKDGAKAGDYHARERAFFKVARENPYLMKRYWDDPNALFDFDPSR